MKSPFRRRATASLTLLSLVLTAACASSGSEADRTLTVGFVVDPSWAQIPVAQDAGYFADEDLEVEVVNFSTGVEALQALAAGQVDVTTAADVPTSAALVQSPSLRVVGDGSRWTGSRIVASAASDIESIDDLAGKRIGTPIGTSAAYFAASALEGSDVDAELVSVQPAAMVTAATQNDVDAVAVFQPYQAQAIDALGDDAVVLEAPEGTYQQHSLYLATPDAIADKSDALRAFFTALSTAGQDLTDGTAESIDAVTDATQLGRV